MKAKDVCPAKCLLLPSESMWFWSIFKWNTRYALWCFQILIAWYGIGVKISNRLREVHYEGLRNSFLLHYAINDYAALCINRYLVEAYDCPKWSIPICFWKNQMKGPTDTSHVLSKIFFKPRIGLKAKISRLPFYKTRNPVIVGASLRVSSMVCKLGKRFQFSLAAASRKAKMKRQNSQWDLLV